MLPHRTQSATLLLTAIVLVVASGCVARQGGWRLKPVARIVPDPAVLSQAYDAQLDYSWTLVAAEHNDAEALKKIIEFSKETDAAGGVAHGVVLNALRKRLGSKTFDAAVESATSEARFYADICMRSAAEASSR